MCEDGRPRFPIRKFYYTLISVILFFLPVTVMTVAYVVIIYKLWVHRTPGESAALAVTRRTFSGQQTSASMVDALAQIKMKKKVDSDLCSKTRSSADADNRLDAFSGQSRSTNMVPFHI